MRSRDSVTLRSRASRKASTLLSAREAGVVRLAEPLVRRAPLRRDVEPPGLLDLEPPDLVAI
jgi:hypothetical protein